MKMNTFRAGLGLLIVGAFFIKSCELVEDASTANLAAEETAADFSFEVSSSNPLSVSFENESENAEAYVWDFGDGNSSTSTNPTHEYDEAGTYTVELTAIGQGGRDETTETVTVEAPLDLPTADFTFSIDGFDVTFDNGSSNSTSFSWNFGDGNSSEEENPTHTYRQSGSYDVRLTSTNDDGSDDVTKSVTITVEEPVADFTFTTNELTANFTNTSEDATTYRWDFGDGRTSTSTSPSHTYSSPGSYTVQLTAEGEGGSDNVSKTVRVEAAGPVADFTFTVDGKTVFFTNESTNADSYEWLFNDGTSSAATNPTKTYSSAGTYNVSLTATGPGGTDKIEKSIEVGFVTISMTNHLMLSVDIFNNDSFLGNIVANGTATFTIASESTNVITWDLVEFFSSGCGINLGEEGIGAGWNLSNPAGTVELEIDNVVGNTYYYAPVLSNNNANFVYWYINRLTNFGWEANCGVPSGNQDVFLGYYTHRSTTEDVVLDKEKPISGGYWVYDASTSNFEDLNGRYAISLSASAEFIVNNNPKPITRINFPGGGSKYIGPALKRNPNALQDQPIR